ncbi:outer membrane beta-barrel protein [Alteraurantiacibacter aestuarii]|uniref:OmpW/AlkL family protein n=1 Tax=Alteraurantiacibacter aestuarii TaxID=650004 RepID=UPI0031E3409E
MRSYLRNSIAPLTGVLALALTSAIGASPASAQEAGDFQVKVMATAVLPDGKITDVALLGPLPATTQTAANDNVIPTVAIEYFFTQNISLETICCVTQHDVDIVAGPLAGAEAVSNARVIPATFTLKYHLNAGGISPYIGAGPTYFLWINDEPGADTIPLGVTSQSMSNELGFALQAGVDVPVGNGLLVSLDAKRYFVDTTARWYAGNTKVIETTHKLDPWVLSAGVGMRF